MQDVLQVLFKLTCIVATGSQQTSRWWLGCHATEKEQHRTYVFTKCLECVRTVTGLAQDSSARFKKKKREKVKCNNHNQHRILLFENKNRL